MKHTMRAGSINPKKAHERRAHSKRTHARWACLGELSRARGGELGRCCAALQPARRAATAGRGVQGAALVRKDPPPGRAQQCAALGSFPRACPP